MIVGFNRCIEVTSTVVIAPSPIPIIPCNTNMDGRVTAIPPVNAGATSKLVIKAPSMTEVHDAMKTHAMNHF